MSYYFIKLVVKIVNYEWIWWCRFTSSTIILAFLKESLLRFIHNFNQSGPGRPSLNFAALMLFSLKYFETKSRTSSFDGLKPILHNTPITFGNVFSTSELKLVFLPDWHDKSIPFSFFLIAWHSFPSDMLCFEVALCIDLPHFTSSIAILMSSLFHRFSFLTYDLGIFAP